MRTSCSIWGTSRGRCCSTMGIESPAAFLCVRIGQLVRRPVDGLRGVRRDRDRGRGGQASGRRGWRVGRGPHEQTRVGPRRVARAERRVAALVQHAVGHAARARVVPHVRVAPLEQRQHTHQLAARPVSVRPRERTQVACKYNDPNKETRTNKKKYS